MSEDLDPRRKRLIFRSHHRGMMENDLLMGKFADVHVPGMTDDQIAQYEALMDESDNDLFNWISGKQEVPAEVDNEVMGMLRDFRTKLLDA